MLQFSKNLPLLRRRAGYTQEGLAEALHVSRQAVSKWESGLTLPEAATLLPLAELLGCTLDQLMREDLAEEEPKPTADPPPEPTRTVFEAYDRHMDRYAVLIALGTLFIIVGAGTLLSFYGMGIRGGPALVPPLLFTGVALVLLIWGGMSHEDFQRQFPVVPDLYTPEERNRFRRIYRLAMAVSVGSLTLDAGGFLAMACFFEKRGSSEPWAVALLLLVLSGSVGAIVLLGLLEEKYHLQKYAAEAAKLRPRT